ncbi:MAG: hypothetical protein EA381_20830 [Planctomycetaceae bacterium]|nr:MAG: hypothetical protein EA381_20830 [Planctomycetaceae bacterium]
MPNASEWLVGGLAIALASWIGIGAVAQAPSLGRLRRVNDIRSRFGERAATAILLAVAAILLGAGLMILLGARPSYATAGTLRRVPNQPGHGTTHRPSVWLVPQRGER